MPTTLKTSPPSAAQTMTTATRTSGAREGEFNRSIQDPEAFWGEAGNAIDWYKRWDKVLDDSRAPFYCWFTGGQTQHLLQRARPARRNWPSRPARAHLRQPRHPSTQNVLRTANCATPSPNLRARSRSLASAKATVWSFIARWFTK